MRRKLSKLRHVLGATILVSVVLLFGSCSTTAEESELPYNVKFTNKAWSSLDRGEYQSAYEYANHVIERFGPTARRLQKELEDEGARMPPTGAVSEDKKKEIHSRGLLNDVATCYFIKGEALLNLKRDADAKAAFESAASLTYALTWDPKGWFWSPSSEAKNRLRKLMND